MIRVDEAEIVLRVRGTVHEGDVREVAEAVADFLKRSLRKLGWRSRIEVEDVEVAGASVREVEVPTWFDLKERLLEEGLIE